MKALQLFCVCLLLLLLLLFCFCLFFRDSHTLPLSWWSHILKVLLSVTFLCISVECWSRQVECVQVIPAVQAVPWRSNQKIPTGTVPLLLLFQLDELTWNEFLMTAAVRAHLPSFQVVWCQEQNVCESEKRPTSGNGLWFSAKLVCPSWVGHKKNLNNFRTEAATHPGFAPLESSRRSG